MYSLAQLLIREFKIETKVLPVNFIVNYLLQRVFLAARECTPTTHPGVIMSRPLGRLPKTTVTLSNPASSVSLNMTLRNLKVLPSITVEASSFLILLFNDSLHN